MRDDYQREDGDLLKKKIVLFHKKCNILVKTVPSNILKNTTKKIINIRSFILRVINENCKQRKNYG